MFILAHFTPFSHKGYLLSVFTVWRYNEFMAVGLKKQRGVSDRKLLVLTVLLTLVGLVAVADASAPQALNFFDDELFFAKQQGVFALVGLFLFALFSKINYKFWGKVATPLFFISVALLLLVFIPGVGTSALGAKRWIAFGNVSFQPSEFIKLTLAIYIAKVAESKKKISAFFVPVFLVSGLIMFQPDLGTTLVIVGIGITQMFLAGVNTLQFLGGIGVAGLLASALIFFSDYRRERVLTFFEATRDPLGKSYHIRQVLLALGSGGLFGVGLGQSRQKYLFLPEAATDSIFAVIAEELGFIGASALVILFALFVLQAIRIAASAPDDFSKILAGGIAAWIGGQAFLNIGSMIALVPLTGLPLPFVSYGGTALVTALVATGILLNISKHAKGQKK